MPRVSDILAGEGLIEADGALPAGHVTGDITREPIEFPMERDARLQALSRGDEGFLLALAYSTQRGYGRSHPFVGEIRIGEVEIELDVPELDFPVTLGRIRVTECQMVNQFKGSAKTAAAVHPRLRPGLRPERAQGDGDVAVRPGAAGARTRRGHRRRRRRTRNSSSRIPTMCRRPASSSI